MHFAGRASPNNDVIVHKVYMRSGHVDEQTSTTFAGSFRLRITARLSARRSNSRLYHWTAVVLTFSGVINVPIDVCAHAR